MSEELDSKQPLNQPLQRTPLYAAHQRLGGKITPFAGWELPVQYSGVIAEHNAVRSAAGLFDVSHMGEIFCSGPQALDAIQALTCNDLSTIYDGKAQYNAIINPAGGVVDDIIVYRYSAERFLICVNASNADKDFTWFTKHNRWDAKFENCSAEFGQIALQGPQSVAIVSCLAPERSDLAQLKYFHFIELELAGVPVIAARTGYTGEDGYEFFVPAASTEILWNALLEGGAPLGLVPAGLGARDSLRLEACYPLHGHELGDDISAVESGLSWIVKLKKQEFTGRAVLEQHFRNGAPRTLVGFFVDDAGIARHGDRVFSSTGAFIGTVTSGTKTPTVGMAVGKALGMALVESKFAAIDTPLTLQVRDRSLKAHVTARPFYKMNR